MNIKIGITLTYLSILILSGCGDDSGTTTPGNRAPNLPSNPSPPDGSVNQNINLQLSWDCSDPDGDVISYDVYLGPDSIPQLLVSDISQRSYSISQLNFASHYFWRLIARDEGGLETIGPIWHFSTREINDTIQYIGTYDIEPEYYSGTKISIRENIAFVAALGSALLIFDLVDPESPIQISTADFSGTPNSIFVNERFALISSNSLYIVDISNPYQPETISSYSAASYDACITDNYAYVCSDYDLLVLNITDPYSPHLVASVDSLYPRKITIKDNRAYLIRLGGKFTVLDIADPTDPVIIGEFDHDYPPFSFEDFSILDNYAFLIGGGPGEGGIYVFDIVTSDIPELIGNYATSCNHILVRDNFAFTGSGIHLRIFNISDPINISEVLHYPIGDGPAVIHSISTLGNYIYLATGDLEILLYNP